MSEDKKVKNEKKGEVVEINDSENIMDSVNEGIEVSPEVVSVIAGVAVGEVQGVAGMSGSFAGDISEAFSGKKNFAKGIKVDINGKKVVIDINIIVEFGSRIPDVAYEIQNRVKKSVENMTGLQVEEVNVHVQGINIKKAEAQDEKQK